METVNWSPGMTLEELERHVIAKALRFYRGNKTTTANALGIAIRTLDNKLEKYERDEIAEKEFQANERQKRADWLTRSRGVHGAQYDTATGRTDSYQANAGLGVESPVNVTAKPTMPMQERAEVQTMLPKQTAQGGQRGRR